MEPETTYKNRHNKQGSVMINTEMGATDLASLVTPPLAEGEAFFELGMKYASGRLGPADLVTAHKWFNIAVARGCRTRPCPGSARQVCWLIPLRVRADTSAD